jgi:hypothetical protein
MAFNVSNEHKAELLTQRIVALNLEGYQHELNKKSAEALGNSEVVAQSVEAIAIIESAITVHEAELADLA